MNKTMRTPGLLKTGRIRYAYKIATVVGALCVAGLLKIIRNVVKSIFEDNILIIPFADQLYLSIIANLQEVARKLFCRS